MLSLGFRCSRSNLRISHLKNSAPSMKFRQSWSQVSKQSSKSSENPIHKLNSWMDDKKLKGLESRAARNPDDATVQLNFISKLGEKHPEAVVQWCESGKFAMDSSIFIEYRRALSRITVSRRGAENLRGSKGKPAQNALIDPGVGFNEANPIHVTVSSPSVKQMAFKLVGNALFLFIAVAAIGGLTESGSFGSRLMPGTQINMASSNDKKFKDVMGVDEVKEELEEVVEYLKNPKKFTRLGGKLTRGILLTGPPGTGKTLLARAIAGEAEVPFFYTSGSEFEEMFVGLGAKRVRDLFREAKLHSPCIIFIDEIDAVGSSRNVKYQQYSKQTLNQLLVEMDGFEQNNGVIVIAATNFPESLDRALTRPGRFDRLIDVPMPDIKGRLQILELYGSKSKLDKSVNLKTLARATPGMSGADLFNLINQAALKASLVGASAISMDMLEWAKDKILMGSERKSAVISKETAKLTAYHEAGHALMALKTEGAHPIHKATIMPRGRSLGMVVQLPEGDSTNYTKKQLKAFMDVAMGGRVSEELFFGEENVTGGASNDMTQATNIARVMVMNYGMSSKIKFMEHKYETASEETKRIIDSEIKALLDDSYNRAKALIDGSRSEVELLANALLEYETLSGDEIKEVLSGKSKLHRVGKPKSTIEARAAAANSVGIA